MKFEDRIKQNLRDLNQKQLCQFAWLCGLRALPFLSKIRDFAYWPMEKRQIYLYSIFNALDVSALAALTDDIYADATKAAYAVNAAVNAAVDAGKAAYAVNAAYADNIKHSGWESLLLKDIEAIKKNKLNECNHDINVYGKLWDRLQEDLKAIDCTYWAESYENLFNNGFTVDKEQLERHLGVPDEVKAEGAAAAGRYLGGLGGEVERLNEARIIILGEKGAGKTSLARRLFDIDAEMPEEYESTEGVVTSLWRFPGKDGAYVNTHIWDFAGHSITHAVHRCFMSARCLYIYVYNGRIERDNDHDYWLEQIRIHGDDSPVLFLINEKDDHRADIAEKTLKDEYPSIVDYYRVDIGSEDKTKLEKFRQTVMDTVNSNPSWNSQVVSMEAYNIKDELRELFHKTKPPHITREQFDEIAQNCGASAGRIEDILKDLHTLGICLWYNKPEMEDFNITARIIVQRSEEIFDEKLLWRKGAVLRYKGSETIALIIEESRSINIHVKGTEKTAYIASLRETLKAIFDDYKVIKPDLEYEVLLSEKPVKSESPVLFEKEKPLMLSEEVIRGYLQFSISALMTINIG